MENNNTFRKSIISYTLNSSNRKRFMNQTKNSMARHLNNWVEREWEGEDTTNVYQMGIVKLHSHYDGILQRLKKVSKGIVSFSGCHLLKAYHCFSKLLTTFL